jgi:ADP-ribose pyrophosphatase
VTAPDASRIVYDGKQIDLVVEQWGDREREIVEHPGSTAIVAVDAEGYVTLVRQLREPARKRLLELPAGTLEPGEQPLETAKRELAEEVGLRGGDWTELGAFYTTPGFCRERMHVFLAENVAGGEASPQADEEVETVRWRVEDVASRLDELEDAKTIAGLLLYLQTRRT